MKADDIATLGVAKHGITGAIARVEAAHEAMMMLNDEVLAFAVEDGDVALIAACFAKATEAFDVRHRLLAAITRRSSPTVH